MAAFQKGLTAMVITDLSHIKSLNVIERVKMQALLQELSLIKKGLVGKNDAPQFAKMIQAEQIVTGTIDKGSIKTSTTVASQSSPDMGSFNLKYETSEFFKLEKEIVRNIIEALGIKLSDDESKNIGIVHTKNLESFKFYSQGLDQFDNKAFDEAIKLFQQALKSDPNFALAQSQLDSTPAEITVTLGLPKDQSQCGN